MAVTHGIFGDASNFDQRYVPDYTQLTQLIGSLRNLGSKIVLTSGSFDMVHEGHALYLEHAKSCGDVLVVGVDNDEKIRTRKGSDRPIVPEDERLRMLTHFRSVDILTLKGVSDPKWALIKAVRPDVLVATIETYTAEQIAELEKNYCGKVQVMERMAVTTTSARLRKLNIDLASRLAPRLVDAVSKHMAEHAHSIINDAIDSEVRP